MKNNRHLRPHNSQGDIQNCRGAAQDFNAFDADEEDLINDDDDDKSIYDHDNHSIYYQCRVIGPRLRLTTASYASYRSLLLSRYISHYSR